MKHLSIVFMALLVAAIACGAPVDTPEATAEPTDVPVEPTAESTAELTPEPTSAEPTSVPATETPTITEGFTTGNIVNPNLPILAPGPSDAPGCYTTEEDQEIKVFREYGTGNALICIHNYPDEDNTRVRITTDGPIGSNYSTFYKSGDEVYDLDGVKVGRIFDYEGHISWYFDAHIAAWYPADTWTFTAELDDGSLSVSTTVDYNAMNWPYMTFTTFDPPPDNPFVTIGLITDVAADFYDADYVFSPGSEVFIYGRDAEPNSTFTLALYTITEGTPGGIAATTITADENGYWNTSYIFPDDAPLGNYYFIINPTDFYYRPSIKLSN